MDAGGLISVVAAEDCRGNVGTGEIHLRRQVLWRIQPRHVGGVHAEVGRVVVKERKRAGQLGLLVDHLEKTLCRQRVGIVTVLQVYLGILFANYVLILHFLHNVRFFTS